MPCCFCLSAYAPIYAPAYPAADKGNKLSMYSLV